MFRNTRYTLKRTAWQSLLNALKMGIFFGLAPCAVCAASTSNIPMTPGAWIPHGDLKFLSSAQFPSGIIAIKTGTSELRDVNFSNGTIEFDAKFDGGITGVTFRQHDDTGDALYFRPSPDCPTDVECIQYMPVAGGDFEWDLFPQYQTAAPIHVNQWNHIKMVVSGFRMNVYINHSTLPTLSIGRLEGDFAAGVIKLHGHTSYANLTVTADQTEGLASEAEPDPTDSDGRYLRTWQVTIPTVMPSQVDAAFKQPTGIAPHYADMPSRPPEWHQVNAERKGLINLTRLYGSSKTGPFISLAWLKTTVISSTDQEKRVAFGWGREAWVFVNGELVFADRNIYGEPTLSKAPDGRITLENGGFILPLKKGANEIAIALDDNFPDGNRSHYGWGFELRLDNDAGVTMVGNPVQSQH